jgi:predicted acyl esterase
VGLLGNLFDSVGGLPVDPVARLDMSELRYQWFDHVFKGAPKPVLLADKVNYEVTGADVWKHAPTIGRMSNGSLRFYCSAVGSGVQYHLSLDSVAYEKFIPLKVDLADRSDVDREPPSGVSDTAVDLANGIEFVSDPLPPSTEINGLFSGRLEFMSNKKDFDFEIDLYELTRRGQYIQLAPYWTRASYAEDLSHRHLLNPGRHHKLEFHSIRLMSRRLQEGSRLAAVIRIIKEPGRQINYGTGQDVSDESIQEANPPLGIKWSNASYLDIPLWK